MRTKCNTCLCNTCMTVCCDRKNCTGKKEACENYRGFRQLRIFEQNTESHMRILVACEESQRVCIEFRRLGHEAYSCDIEPCSGGHPEWHIQTDVLPLLNGDCSFYTVDGAEHSIVGKWDMIIAFPPYTYLTNTGNRWFNIERYGDKAVQRYRNREWAIQFFMQFVNADCEKIAIENQVGAMSTAYRKPDQIIQPWMFGDPFEKTTCLWFKNLKNLEPTGIVTPPPRHITSRGNSLPEWYSKGGKDRQKNRSKTFPGVAKAMADQWGKVNNLIQPQCQSVPRHSWEYYGISKDRYRQLTEYIQSGRYATVASQAAHRANKDIAEYILLSVTQNKSYDILRAKWELKEMERIPYCRTDFYGIRRYFFAIMNEEMRRIGK